MEPTAPTATDSTRILPPGLLAELENICFRSASEAARREHLVSLLSHNPGHDAAIRGFLQGLEVPFPGEPGVRQIGPYRILFELGRGGFGEVYLAEQDVPVRRRVALKVLKLGMDSRAILARFTREQASLARMNHDAVAKIFDAGTTPQGQSFFVMELVEGQPITQYCDEHRLDLRQRIELFQRVCLGVQHAHQKGVVHRDLKPGNVLVAKVGDLHAPKLIDFGIARAIEGDDAEAGLTETGMVLGTPAYMAPEQAKGDPGLVDTRTDVYALGAILYQLLTGAQPFVEQVGGTESPWDLRQRILVAETPRPSLRAADDTTTLARRAQHRRMAPSTWLRSLRGDLDWIVLKAMAKAAEDRYGSAAELAADLGRYLQQEPVLAGPPSALYRLRKFVRRYQGQVGAVVAVVLASLTFGAIALWQYGRAETKAAEALEQKGRAETNAALANDRAAEALREKGRADAKVHEFDQLAGVVLLDRVLASEAELHPAWPHRVDAMEAWLRDARRLLAMQPEIESTVRDLRARALPATAEEQEADRRGHAKFAEFELVGKRVAALRYAQAIRAGTAKLVVPDLTAEQLALDTKVLNTLAWYRVAPKPEERKVYGEEAFGLACARAAVAKAAGTPGRFQLQDTLAWALVANGQDAAARAASEQAWNLAPEDQSAKFEEFLSNVRAAIEKTPETLATAEELFAGLETVVNERRTFRFELEGQRFLHDTLVELLGSLGSLASKEKVLVEQRLAWSKQIHGLTLAHPNCKHPWEEVRTSIAQNPKYVGQEIELGDQGITGLVPLGMNPVTKLWEFYDLRSAWDGKCLPKDIPIPAHKADGSIEVTGELGIVFVLLPGGTSTMGAQKNDKDEPNFDAQARDDETPYDVALVPFFLARHEMTQGQWLRLWSGDPAFRQPSQYKAGNSVAGDKITLANPVECVDWQLCTTLLSRHGLVLPTEAQWEYGCRAGTSSPWLCPFDELKVYANLADASAKSSGVTWQFEAWSDGHVAHGPVGSFSANAFGLYDVHGNVWEWCRDWYWTYGTEQAGDGLRLGGASTGNRVSRGGSFSISATLARSAHRQRSAPSFRANVQGVRPARSIHR